MPARQRKLFEKAFKHVIIEILFDRVNDTTISKYFYDLLSEDYEINKTWELLADGNDRSLDKKEVQLINQIIGLVKEQGYTDFFILVDEFEDITEGRLSKAEIDNYLRNLRTLIDQNREWRVVFAMTARALDKIKITLPPLADRLTIVRFDYHL